MNNEWKEYKLGEVAEVVGGGTPDTTNLDYWNGDICWLTPRDLAGCTNVYISKGERNISEKGLKNSSAKLLPKGTILLTSRAPIGYIAIANNTVCTNQGFKSLIPNDKILHNIFLYYWLKNNVTYLQSIGTGSTFTEISGSVVKEINILLPSLSTQQRIADILSSLDDKIDLLNRQNATLEAMAETLFRHHFIDNAKEDWKEVLITELFEVKDGTHDSPREKEFGNKLITSKHLSGNSIDFSSAYYISKEDYLQINQRSKVDTNDILFSMIGTIGRIYLEQSDKINYAIKNLGLFKTSQNKLWTYFSFLWLKSSAGFEFIQEHISGSTQEYISLGSLRSITFKVPEIEKIIEFNSHVNDFFIKIKSNQKQIITLTNLRDTLLPKLMSGEVKI